jgi:hypothetical protein
VPNCEITLKVVSTLPFIADRNGNLLYCKRERFQPDGMTGNLAPFFVTPSTDVGY